MIYLVPYRRRDSSQTAENTMKIQDPTHNVGGPVALELFLELVALMCSILSAVARKSTRSDAASFDVSGKNGRPVVSS